MTRWIAEAPSILVIGRIKLFEKGMWVVLNLKPCSREGSFEGEASGIRQMQDIGSDARASYGEYREAIHSIQRHD